ncbi:uncharacterized protein [Acropora muricata]|uniref:uncharacterized protein n=1 Tax=Acropora muricata TaxID=159855 RepID=UPI0034E606CB
MLILSHKEELRRFLIYFLFFILGVFSEGKKHTKHIKDHDVLSSQKKQSKSTFITVRIPEHIAIHRKDCIHEGKLHHHGDAWSPGPCIPECRCKSGHVKCSKIECPDLNCENPIKKKWKCCPECLAEMKDGYSCGVWTKGGNGNGECCVFPFSYHGVNYFTCTYQDHSSPWCAVTSDFDQDGVWGECIDTGDSVKALRFKTNGRKYTNETYDGSVENIANQAVINLKQPLAKENVSSPGEQGVTPAVPLPMGPSVTSTNVIPNESAVVKPVPTGIPIVPATVSTALAPVTSVGIQASGSEAPMGSSSITGVSPTAQIPMQSVSAVMPTVAPLPGAGVPVKPISTVAPSITTGILVQSPVPAPLPGGGLPLIPGIPGVPVVGVSQTSNVVINPSPVASVTVAVPGQPGVAKPPYPEVTYPVGATPPLQPQPATQTSQVAQTGQQPLPVVPTVVTPGETQVPGQAPGLPNQLPFPATQTVITPGETQAPGQSAGQGPGQAVHEVTTTEINPTHNITTTESWFGKANETLNRTNEVTNQNYQAPNGYQADPNLYAYQSQTQAASFTNEQSYPTQGDASAAYYSQGYSGYNNDTLSQQYWAEQAQNTGSQDNYYPSQQQYQNAADQGPYYTG